MLTYMHTEPQHPTELYDQLLSEVENIDWDQPDEERYGRLCQAHMRAIHRWQNYVVFKHNRIEAEAWCPACSTEDTGRYDPMLPTRYCVDCIDDGWLERASNYYRSEEITYRKGEVHAITTRASCPTGLTVSLTFDHPAAECAHRPSTRERDVAIHNLLNQARTDCDRMEVTPYR